MSFIVKVQLPIGGNAKAEALVYNEDRSVEGLLTITDSLEKAMAGRPKKFFFAYLVGSTSNPELIVDVHREAPWQDW